MNEKSTHGEMSLKKYASKAFRESSITAVSTIVSASSIPRRLFRIFVLLMCLTGFFYQCASYLNVVFNFPTTIDIDIERPEMLNMPSITFCNNNGIQRSLFCSKYPEHCIEVDKEMCLYHAEYCGTNKTLMPKEEYFNFTEIINLDELNEMRQRKDDFIFRRFNIDGINEEREDSIIQGPELRMKHGSSTPCYTIFSRVNSSLDVLQVKKNKHIKIPVARFAFNVEKDEYFTPEIVPGVFFSVHSPLLHVNPFDTGHFLESGRLYKVHISMEEEVLLPYPYKTDCLNYNELWLKSGKSGYRMQEMCIHSCALETSMRCYNCALPNILYTHEERLCTDNDYRADCSPNPRQEFDLCINKCKDDCSRTKYHYKVQERYTIWNEDLKKDVNMKDMIFVDVYLEGDEIVTLRHIPKYMIFEVFSDIGGYIGLWLGISLVEVNDLLETFFRIARFSWRNRKSIKSRKEN